VSAWAIVEIEAIVHLSRGESKAAETAGGLGRGRLRVARRVRPSTRGRRPGGRGGLGHSIATP